VVGRAHHELNLRFNRSALSKTLNPTVVQNLAKIFRSVLESVAF